MFSIKFFIDKRFKFNLSFFYFVNLVNILSNKTL